MKLPVVTEDFSLLNETNNTLQVNLTDLNEMVNTTEGRVDMRTEVLIANLVATFMLIPGIVGNCLLIFTISREKALHVPTYVLILALSVVDTIGVLVYVVRVLEAFVGMLLGSRQVNAYIGAIGGLAWFQASFLLASTSINRCVCMLHNNWYQRYFTLKVAMAFIVLCTAINCYVSYDYVLHEITGCEPVFSVKRYRRLVAGPCPYYKYHVANTTTVVLVVVCHIAVIVKIRVARAQSHHLAQSSQQAKEINVFTQVTVLAVVYILAYLIFHLMEALSHKVKTRMGPLATLFNILQHSIFPLVLFTMNRTVRKYLFRHSICLRTSYLAEMHHTSKNSTTVAPAAAGNQNLISPDRARTGNLHLVVQRADSCV